MGMAHLRPAERVRAGCGTVRKPSPPLPHMGLSRAGTIGRARVAGIAAAALVSIAGSRPALGQGAAVPTRPVPPSSANARTAPRGAARADAYQRAVRMGELFESKNWWAQAESAYVAGLRENPDELDLHYRLGFLYQESAQYEKAFEQFERMVREHPEEVHALFQIGRTGALSGRRLDRAEQALRSYLKRTPRAGDPPHAVAHYRLGMVLEKRGDRVGAVSEYRAALGLDKGERTAPPPAARPAPGQFS